MKRALFVGKMDYDTTFDAPIAAVFDELSDHEGMTDWPGIQTCRLVAEGDPRNGVGAVREVRALGLRLLEEVVEFEPPTRMAYTITKGLPVEHRGELTLTERDGRTELRWRVRMSSRIPGLARVVAAGQGLGLPRAMKYVGRRLQR